MRRVRPLRHMRAPALANGAYPLPRNPSSLETTRNNKGGGRCQYRLGIKPAENGPGANTAQPSTLKAKPMRAKWGIGAHCHANIRQA